MGPVAGVGRVPSAARMPSWSIVKACGQDISCGRGNTPIGARHAPMPSGQATWPPPPDAREMGCAPDCDALNAHLPCMSAPGGGFRV